METLLCSSGLSLKDFVTPSLSLLGTLILGFITYSAIFIKLRKDRRMKWLDELRGEIATFVSFTAVYYHSMDTTPTERISLSATTIGLYLNENIPRHKALRAKINSIVKKTNDNLIDAEKIDSDERKRRSKLIFRDLDDLIQSASEFIDEELKDIERIEMPFNIR